MDIINNRINNLIMCVTPLQMLIAEKIISLKPHENFDLLVISLNDDIKHRNYFKRLENSCNKSLYYVPKTGFKDFFGFIKKLNEFGLSQKYDRYYLANTHFRHFQYIVSKSSKPKIFTFDDGVSNIFSSSKFHINSKPSFSKRIIWRILGVKYYMEDIKMRSLLHYTIYKNTPNIVHNTQYLPLITMSFDRQTSKNNKVVRFFLGQPLTDISTIFDLSFVENNLKKLNIDFYYPHPREKIYPKGDFKLVESPLIFEDYIIQFLENNIDKNIEVFSFTSSALINVATLDGVEVSYIHDKQMLELHPEFYETVEKIFEIPHIDVDNYSM